MTEEMVIKNLVNGRFKSLQAKVNKWIHKFYDNYDPRESLDKSYIYHLSSVLEHYFSNIEEELVYHG